MFENVNESEISDEMKIFWEAQKDVLAKEDARGNRWHPK